MKKIYKSLLLASSVGLMTIALASCGKNTRNSKTPYGTNDIYNSSEVIATADNGNLKMTKSMYYTRLRANSYSVVENKIEKSLYDKEYKAILDILSHDNPAGISNETAELLKLNKNGYYLINDLTATTIDFTGKENNYDYMRNRIIRNISASLSSEIYGTSSAEAIENYENDDKKKLSSEVKLIDYYQNKFVEAKQNLGIAITKDLLSYTQPTDDTIDVITFNHFNELISDSKYESLVDSYILGEAEKLSARNGLYQIGDEEFVHDYNADKDSEKTKNVDFYIYDPETTENLFNTSFGEYGEYRAIVIQYNSRAEATKAIKDYWVDGDSNEDNYLRLYNNYYLKAGTQITSINDDKFVYNYSNTTNDLQKLNSAVETLITDTLEAGECLKTPRNLNNKYVMVYHISTKYTISGTDEKTTYNQIISNDSIKDKYLAIHKYQLLEDNLTSYMDTDYSAKLYELMNNDDKDDDLKIYDPVMEQNYYGNNSDIYTLMNKKDFNNNLMFSINGIEYTLDDFYADASKAKGAEILSNFFQLEYAYANYYDKFVDEDTLKDSTKDLENEISEFKKNNNESYTKDLGLENFLVINYGYTNKEDIVKYFYAANTCLDGYKEKLVFESWAQDGADGKVINTNNVGILNNILTTGNAQYSKLFNINLDHLLINIDYDGDGSPDDPETFLKDMSADERKEFENAVVALAQAIYKEAISGKENYGDNSLYKVLTYIKTQYEENQPLKAGTGTWAQYKTKYNFLITVEQLSSGSDITQSSVSSFVTSFANYVKSVYEKISNQKVDMDDYKNGLFYVFENNDDGGVGTKLTTEADASSITINSLCSTTFGYHLLIVNDYEGPKSTSYTPSEGDTFNKSLSILLIEDEDDETNNVVVNVDPSNSESTAANLNQLFIYYVQKANGATSSLDTDVQSILSTLFDSYISTYQSSNFQTYLLLKKLNITITDTTVQAIKVDDAGIKTTYYANQVIDYGKNKDYATWVDGTTNWDRPE